VENGKLNICHGGKAVTIRVSPGWISEDTFRGEPFFAGKIIEHCKDRTLRVDHICQTISIQITGGVQAGGLRRNGADKYADQEDKKGDRKSSLLSELAG